MRAPAPPRQERTGLATTRARAELPERLVAVDPGTVRPVLAPLELAPLQVLGDGIQVLGVELGTDQARALWAQLGEALGLAQRHRRPKAWGDLQAWLDRAFRPGIPVCFRETVARSTGEGLAVLDGERRALVRVGIFQVAHLVRRKSGGFTGPIADYFPGAMGTGPNCPDAMLAFTGRRIVVRGELLEGAAQVA